jgi:hypothetical protein
VEKTNHFFFICSSSFSKRAQEKRSREGGASLPGFDDRENKLFFIPVRNFRLSI